MIGQNELVVEIETEIAGGRFPHFCIFVGAAGSGKKTLAAEAAKKLGAPLYVVEQGIDGVRTMIRDCYTVKSPVLYLIGDGGSLSGAAKNALLKVTEEPPNSSYIVMCLETLENTLETVRSRAAKYYMKPYSRNEILTYFRTAYRMSDWADDDVSEVKRVVGDVCETPGEVNLLVELGALDLYGYAEMSVDGIRDVGLANAFKASGRICLKKDGEGYDLKLFLKTFMDVCLNRLKKGGNGVLEYSKMVSVTSKALQELGIKGISKQMLFDDWVMNIRNI